MESSVSSHQQAIYAQTKLKNIYMKTCVHLASLRDGVKMLQEAILWKRPFLSVMLYVAVHLLYWYLYYLSDNILTLFGTAIFWILLADGFWSVATRDKAERPGKDETDDESHSKWRTRLFRVRRQRKEMKFLTLEEAIMKNETPLEVGEIAPYEVVCLWISLFLMWADNVQLAMRHWNRKQPHMFTVLVFFLGLCFCVIGYFMSGLLLLYLITLFVLLWPVVVYYNLIAVSSRLVETNYPIFTERLQRYYNIMKQHFRRLPEEEFTDIQLKPVASSETTPPQPQLDPPRAAYYKDPSMTLPPFDPDYNTMDSLASFTPQPHGFHYAPEDSLALPSFSASKNRSEINKHHTLSQIPESSDTNGSISLEEINPSISESNQNRMEMYTTRPRTETLTLTPFHAKDNPLHDSFDFEEIPPTITNKNVDTDYHSSTGISPASTDSGLDQNETEVSPPLMETKSDSSPYFLKKFGSPSLMSSTPLNEERPSSLRHREHKES